MAVFTGGGHAYGGQNQHSIDKWPKKIKFAIRQWPIH